MRPLIALFSIILLGGCAHSPNSMFRNRTFDYTNTTVVNQNLPATPEGLATPHFQPKFAVPNAKVTYAPEGQPDLTPPGFHQVVSIPALPPAKMNS